MLSTSDKSSLLEELKAAGAEVFSDQKIRCPFHDDRTPSGGLYEKDGVWRYKCHAASCGFCGDAFDVLARAENRPVKEVFKESQGIASLRARKDEPKVYASIDEIKVPGEIEATYVYTHPETRKADLVVIRYRKEGKKAFWQVSPRNGGWVLKRPDGLLPLYNRIQVAASGVVVVVEGEKCVHTLRAHGFTGTTSPMGAGKASYADWGPLAGKVLILWPDNDEGGLKHMREVAEIVSHLDPAPKVYWVEPDGLHLPPKGDVADFVAGMTPEDGTRAIAGVLDASTPLGAAGELHALLEDTIEGRRDPIMWPWPSITSLSMALLPGTVTLFCGSAGASKSFAILQALSGWLRDGVRCSVFELEEDRAYHLHRCLAQEAGDSGFLDPKWVKANTETVRRGFSEHRASLEAFGRCIYAAPHEQMDYGKLVAWTQAQADSGVRVIVIDPVTAISPCRNVWVADSDFVFKIKTIARERKCSIVLVTHPRKGRGPTVGMDDLAGGAAFQRFSQTILWLESFAPKRVYQVKGPCGTCEIECNRVLHMLKTRNGPGMGLSVGLVWDPQTLTMAEQGIIVKLVKSKRDNQ